MKINDYNNTSIYMLQYHKYDNDKKASASFGILKEIEDKFKIKHNCYKSVNYKGAPILQLSNKKLIGIQNDYLDNDKTIIEGIFLKYAINEYLNYKKENNEINMEVKIEKEDIKKKIDFISLEKVIIKTFINNKKYKRKNFFEPENEGIYSIKIKYNYSIIKHIYFSNC